MEAMKLLWLLLLLTATSSAHPTSTIRLPDITPTIAQEINDLQADSIPKRTRSVAKAEVTVNNIDKTIAEVEEIIKSNPQYPKLTRGEILDLLENITKNDPEIAKSMISTEREDGKRAIMVVMPFTPGNKNQMADLYTKQPVTHIIGEPFKTTTNTPAANKGKEPVPNVESLPITDLFPDLKKEVIATPKPTRLEEIEGIPELVKPLPQSQKPLRRRRPELTTPKTFEEISSPTPTPRQRTTTSQAIKHENHKYSEDAPHKEVIPLEGMTVISAPNLAKVEEDIPKKVLKTRKRTTTTTTTEKAVELLSEIQNVQSVDNHEISSVVGLFTTTTIKPLTLPDISNVADSLSPEMRELLASFGLLPNPNEKSTTPTLETAPPVPETAEVKADSYVGFKPLPDDAPSRDDMASFLASFGLGRDSRKHKQATTAKPQDKLDFDVVPEEFKPVLSDIGLVQREAKKIREEDKNKNSVAEKDTDYVSEDELRKLNKLLEAIKVLEKLNNTATDDELKNVDISGLKDLVGSLNSEKMVPLDEQGAPDPLKYDYGLSKNEVKRQQSTQEESKQKLADLEASFGGSSEAPTATIPPPTEEPRKKSGFYYLLDWNSFFDIDNQKGKRVNLRFQPKVGDPKRFLSVSVP